MSPRPWCTIERIVYHAQQAAGSSCCRKGTSKVQKAAIEERRQAATLASIRALPSLMRKHQTDPVQVIMRLAAGIFSVW